MKNKKILDAFSQIDEAYVEEANPQYNQKKPPIVWKKLAYLAVAACLMLAIVLPIAFWGGERTQVPDHLKPYQNSPYYALIEKLDAYYQKKHEKDDALGVMTGAAVQAPTPDLNDGNEGVSGETSESLVSDITDNQVAGVIEGDIVKRTATHIFVIQNDYLYVYTIDDINSRVAGWYQVADGDCKEMFLLDGGKKALLVINSYRNGSEKTELILLNTRLPANIQEEEKITLDGYLKTSRVTEDSILIFTNHYVWEDELDFSDPCRFVPCITDEKGTKPISCDDIIMPEEINSLYYSVIYSLDSETLKLEGGKAFLGGTGSVYVSKNNIFVASSQVEIIEREDGWDSISKTLIRCFPYGRGSLEEKGTVLLDGAVKNQYSMDEKDGILRVVTTNQTDSYQTHGDVLSIKADSNTNASLYCVSLDNFETVAGVERFAPDGETVKSVRFDGDYAYVCTSVTILSTIIDPVFFFDLSDLSNITYTDTGEIEGFSSSLVDFENGNLLGIGHGSDLRELKIEIYREENESVVSVAEYRDSGWFSGDYKCYYIDRENQLIGLCINRTWDDRYGLHYILLHFDGENLVKLVDFKTGGDLEKFRSVYIDGYLYIIGSHSAHHSLTFKVLEVELPNQQ